MGVMLKAYKDRWAALLSKEMPCQKIVGFFAKFLDLKTRQRGMTNKGMVNCCVLLTPK